jgi:hypothetical protein
MRWFHLQLATEVWDSVNCGLKINLRKQLSCYPLDLCGADQQIPTSINVATSLYLSDHSTSSALSKGFIFLEHRLHQNIEQQGNYVRLLLNVIVRIRQLCCIIWQREFWTLLSEDTHYSSHNWYVCFEGICCAWWTNVQETLGISLRPLAGKPQLW